MLARQRGGRMTTLPARATVFVGPGAAHLLPRLERELRTVVERPPIAVAVRRFPDGESCVDVATDWSERLAVLVQGTQHPQDSNVVQLLQMVDAVRRLGAREISCVVPYFGYGRQDKAFRAGEPASAIVVLCALAALGVRHLVTFDMHNPGAVGETMTTHEDVGGADLLSSYFAPVVLRRMLWVSPDAGGAMRVRRAAQAVGAEWVALDKRKQPDSTAIYDGAIAAANGRDVLVVDDVCSTGSTLVPLAQRLAESGARRITAFYTHFCADSDAIVRRVGFEIELIATNTIPNGCARIAIEPSVAAAVRRFVERGRLTTATA
jgi:ribose-phosphate pyrophosphokinase